MDMKKWMDGLRCAEIKKSMPVLSFPCVSLMGVTVRELINDPELQARGMKLVADTVPSAAAVSMMDLSVEAEAFGAQIRISDDEVPTVIGSIISDEDGARALRIPNVGEGRTGLYVKALEKACKLITDRPVFAGVIGPFSLAGRLLGVTEALMDCYDEPEKVHITLEKVTGFIIDYITAYKNIGANGIVMAEPLTGLLSPELAEEFSEPYVRRINDAVQTDEFISIYHNCGNSTVRMSDSILRTNAAAYHFGNAISMSDMLACMPGDVAIMGNIDPASQFLNGTPDSMREAVLSLMNELCDKYPNFIISSGCDIPPMSKWENINAYFNAVDEYYRSK